ncbi:MAG: hypothetical protein HOZ81_20170 [Streptomyces sp.]|nr:hypothetical protein [Streptomyces sp.]NUS81858.1 hypothetical protein [Streptomyces sp.]
MTATVKPLPAHGTYARGNGAPGYREPCKCEPCHKAMRRGRKQHHVNRQLGRPGLIDAAPARQRLNQLTPTMTWGQICEATGCESRNLQLIADGRRTQIRRSTHDRIMAVKLQAPAPGKYVDSTGLCRRLRALRAIGWSALAIAEKASSAEARIQKICSGTQPTVRQVLAEKLLKVYAELSQTPAPTGRSATRTKRHAAANGWAPPGAWDDDTIDDPEALPDWTGHCGTDRGWWLHNVNGIPVCARCQEAHDAWLAERKHLPAPERFRQLAFAKGAATNRGAALAADARELIRVSGLGLDQVAQRLGVTRDYIQQELARHPDTDDTTPTQTEQELAA